MEFLLSPLPPPSPFSLSILMFPFFIYFIVIFADTTTQEIRKVTQDQQEEVSTYKSQLKDQEVQLQQLKEQVGELKEEVQGKGM